jgi:hypothetical protein
MGLYDSRIANVTLAGTVPGRSAQRADGAGQKHHLYGLLVPTLGRTFAVMRTNRRIAAVERAR